MGINNDLNLNFSLTPPLNFEELNKSSVEQQADAIVEAYPELSRDEVISYVQYYNSIGVDLNQNAINNLLAGDPVLADPAVVNTVMSTIIESKNGNPWLNANPFATFFILFLELQSELSKIKVAEGMTQATMINLTLDMSKDLAGIIKQIYENEAHQLMVAAICAGVGGGLSAIGGGFSIGTGNMGWQAMGQGMGQIVTMAEKLVASDIALQRASLEFFKTIIENAMKVLQDRGMGSASESQRTADEMISQILQKLDKIIDEAYKAHGFQVH
jgi:hypothetical protein